MPTIELTQGQRARVDWCDYREISQHRWYAEWCANTKSFRAARRKNGKNVFMHREIVDAPSGLEVDHRNHDTLDNRRGNLRLVTTRQNHENRRDQSKFGVGVLKDRDRFQAGARIDGRWVHIGSFETAEEAQAARERFFRDGTKYRQRAPSKFGPGIRRQRNRFRLQVSIRGRLHHVGMFGTPEEAQAARRQFLEEHL